MDLKGGKWTAATKSYIRGREPVPEKTQEKGDEFKATGPVERLPQ